MALRGNAGKGDGVRGEGKPMSACIYYRHNRCDNAQRCQYKILANDGSRQCQKQGDLPDMDKSSEHFKKVED